MAAEKQWKQVGSVKEGGTLHIIPRPDLPEALVLPVPVGERFLHEHLWSDVCQT